ncbi:MAG: hypothetical protein ACRDRN_23200 [Sciscionella sp.]
MFMREMGGTLSAVQIAIDELDQIANGKVGELHDAASESATQLGNGKVHGGAFSKVPAAEALERQQDRVHQVFEDTVKGVKADLEDFCNNLRACVKEYQSTDDNAQAALLGLGKRWEGHTYHSQADYETSRKEQGTGLQRVNAGQDGSSGDGSSSSGTQGGPESGTTTPPHGSKGNTTYP